VPKEFLPNHANLRLITRVNGKIMQDQTTADLIWNEAKLSRYSTSILMLYPGDVISTGTPWVADSPHPLPCCVACHCTM